MKQQELDQLEHQLREIAFDTFNERGQWPTVNQVHRELLRRYPDAEAPIRDVRDYFRHASGATYDDAEASLGVRELLDLKQAGHVLFDYLNVVRYIGKKQRESKDDKPHITAAELRTKFSHFRDLDTRRIHRLLQREIFFLGGGGAGDDFDQEIYADAHLFRNATTMPDYLAIHDRLIGRVTVPPAPSPQASTPIGFRRP